MAKFTVNVDLGERSYPIHIGEGLLGNADLLNIHLGQASVLVVTNETVAPLYLDQLVGLLGASFRDAVILKDGEKYKTLIAVNEIYDCLLAGRFDRDSILLALGGGVVGDITGFAAATYQRGIGFIQIPTTLLAQVDSSVGGKTGVNHALGKNMIGAFHQPLCVIADTRVLDSLPDRELRAGIAEVIKYGLICDAGFFTWLENNRADLLARNPETLARAIESSCRYKAEIVARDEREGGDRALLNLGHTFGHAIETATGYSSWLHGEAVAVGMTMAADLSMRLGWISEEKAQAIRHALEKFGLPVEPPGSMSATQFVDLMSMDKKVKGQAIRFVLLKDIGKAVIEKGVPQHLLVKTLNAGNSLCYE